MIYIVAGVSGSGKSTIAEGLASALNLEYIDADDFHPDSNRSKMSKGIPLNDSDREPWLLAINQELIQAEQKQGIILACSALKKKYRQTLEKDLLKTPIWIFLEGSFETIYNRMKARKHFMPASLLQSQFDTYETPDSGLRLDIRQNPEQLIEKILAHMDKKAEIGLIGLGVMGKSLSRNIARNGFHIHVYNRHVDGKEEQVAANFVKAFPELANSKGFDNLGNFVAALEQPRKVFLMVNAGKAVDTVIKSLLPHLDKGDMIIDGGNSHYKDTQRRFVVLEHQGIEYIGTGVSGGELGALNGPSIMPGGSPKAYQAAETILTKIAAQDKVDKTCCAFIGEGGAGHFVKMVHNGIEYAEMQLIAEVYGILRFAMQKSPEEISTLFAEWNEGDCGSYLLEITRDILLRKEEETQLIDIILDKAGNKGTGSWTTIAACELGVAIPTITAALFARYQSAAYDARQTAAKVFAPSNSKVEFDLEQLRQAYQQARLLNHNQGFELIREASKSYDWKVDTKELARIWTNGCIIRSKLMETIYTHHTEDPLILNPNLNSDLISHRSALQEIVAQLAHTNISSPCFSASLSYLNGSIEQTALANIIQAQRDYFGAHTYERRDAPRGQKFHTEWE